MGNRIKGKPDTCPFCYHKSRYKNHMLCETYPFLKHLWCDSLNEISFDQVAVASEKYGVFELLDGRVVSVRICNLSNWLYTHPDRRAEEYLEQQWEKAFVGKDI